MTPGIHPSNVKIKLRKKLPKRPVINTANGGSTTQKKYRDAILQFDSVVTDYPTSDKVPSALLKKGYAYIALGEKAQGIVQLQYVVHEHPKSPEAAKARDELKRLGVETR